MKGTYPVRSTLHFKEPELWGMELNRERGGERRAIKRLRGGAAFKHWGPQNKCLRSTF